MMNKESKYINVKGQLMNLSEPRVMGILNVTPDSFYSESRLQTVEKIAARVVEIVNEGADFIDIGAYLSSECRPCFIGRRNESPADGT